MKTKLLSAVIVCGSVMFPAIQSKAQDAVVFDETIVTISEDQCKTHYYSNGSENWFLQFGAGATSPFVENYLPDGSQERHITAVYNVGFGKWFSPYIGWRMSFLGGSLHWDNHVPMSAKWVNGNFDFMWDMFNTFGGVNTDRRFSIVPFVGMGGIYTWDYKPSGESNVQRNSGEVKTNSWSLPLSAGLQLRLRLCSYADFFIEGRSQFVGDNFNNYVGGAPIDMNLSVIGGFSINFGGSDFNSYDPCDYSGYVRSLNNEVNELRASLDATAAALAIAQSQQPVTEVIETVKTVVEQAPIMATVRFKIDSAVISEQEMVTIYNVAQWLRSNPEEYVAIVGYADKDTGSPDYNLALSKRRAEAVRDVLVNTYGIDTNRLEVAGVGSDMQPYEQNNWNRIVIISTIQ